MKDFAAYYVEANIVCVVVFGILLVHNHFNIDRQETQVKYDRALLAFICYFLADSFWAASVAEFIPKTRVSVLINDFLIYLLMAAITYFWLDYVMAVEKVPHRGRPINRFAVIFPFLASTAALIVHYLVAPEMLLDEQLDALPAFSAYLAAVPIIYLLAILFYALRRSRAEKTLRAKRKHLFIGLFPLVTLVGGMIQMIFLPYTPIYCFTSMILMLMFHIQSIEARISQDPLTNLNNRGELIRYISQKGNLFLENRLTVAVMMDINKFKGINDTYGHAEGDKALVIIADSLKQVLSRRGIPCFLGRYGGDEFILILHPSDLNEVEQLIREIRGEIARRCEAEAIPYPLTVSAGYEELTAADTIQLCIQRADDKLYLDKRSQR